MKTEKKKGARWKAIAAAGALLAAPVTLYAVSGDILDIYGGSNSFVYSSSSGGYFGLGAIGYANSLDDHVRYSLAVGTGNMIHAYGWSNPAEGSLAVGNYNTVVEAVGAFVSGSSNSVTANNAAAIGSYLISDSADGVVVGKWNDATAHSGEAFVVGVGTGAGDEKNGLIVLDDGTVLVPEPQGDISVGNYQ